jgi:hypothetical protein
MLVTRPDTLDYNQIPMGNSSNMSNTTVRKCTPRALLFFLATAIVAIMTLTAFVIRQVQYNFSLPSNTPKNPWSSAYKFANSYPYSSTECGSTPREARLRGCHFDVMNFAWLSDECYDEGLTADFLVQQHWQWFEDPEDTSILPKQSVMEGEYLELFVTWEYHRFHCVHMWQKMHRALAKGIGMNSYIGNYQPTDHCSHMLLSQGNSLDSTNTMIWTKYPWCYVL